ncbi:MAG: ATP-binding protein [Gemmatimonadota bacterium]
MPSLRTPSHLTAIANALQGASPSETVSLYIVQLDPLQVVFNTRPISSLIGYSAETHPEMTLDTVHELMHPDDTTRLQEYLKRLRTLVDGEVTEFRHRMRAASGDWAWIEVRDAVLTRDDDGVPIQVIGTAREVTARMQAADALLASEARHRLLVETMLQGVVRHAPDGTIIGLNAAAERILGRPREAFIGSDPVAEERHTIREDGSSFPGAEHPSSVAMRTAAPSRGVVMGVFNHELGEYRWLRVDAVPLLRRGESVPYEVYTVFEDISRERQDALALQDAHTRKDHFIATLAHELRNPLAPIRNAVAVMRLKGSADPQLIWCQEIIDRQVGHMSRLLDDLLDASRISSGKLELRRQRVALSDVIAQSVETARPLLDAAQHTLTISLGSAGIYIDGDPMRVAQIFSNLLTNAAKYSEPGGIITVSSEVRDAQVHVSVRDTGIGIDAQHLPRIFEMFGQVESAQARSQDGLGIGLSLAQALVEMHGGRIAAHSDGPGRGTEFTVTLPLSLAGGLTSNASTIEATLIAGTRRRVLVVDDNRDGCDSLAALLRLSGFSVETVYDGVEAVARARNWQPEVVLLDIGLPTISGYEVCEAIRSDERGDTVLVIALTGWGSEADLRHARESGFDAHFVKPIDITALATLLPLSRAEVRERAGFGDAARRQRHGKLDAPRPVT